MMMRFDWPTICHLSAGIIVAVLFGHAPSYGCCWLPETPEVALSNAAAVFSGKVTEYYVPHRRPALQPNFPFITINKEWHTTLVVQEVWKGDVPEVVTLFDEPLSSVSFAFKRGETYIVYAYADVQGRLRTSSCHRTAPRTRAGEDLAVLGRGANPISLTHRSSLGPISSLAAALMLPTFLLWLINRKRRKAEV